MKTFTNKFAYLMLCAVLLVLPASATLNNSTVFENKRVRNGNQLAMPKGAASNFATSVQAINYGNCAELYAVQPGDTLDDIAKVSATTTGFVMARNDLKSADDIFPGLVLCLETANNGGIPCHRRTFGCRCSECYDWSECYRSWSELPRGYQHERIHVPTGCEPSQRG